jgi:hypothetical protein
VLLCSEFTSYMTHSTLRRKSVSGHGVVLRRRGGHRGTDPTGLHSVVAVSCMSFLSKPLCPSTVSSSRNNPSHRPRPRALASGTPQQHHQIAEHNPPFAPHLRIRLVLHLDQPQGSNAACGIRLLALPHPQNGQQMQDHFLFLIPDSRKKERGKRGVMSGLACVRFRSHVYLDEIKSQSR